MGIISRDVSRPRSTKPGVTKGSTDESKLQEFSMATGAVKPDVTKGDLKTRLQDAAAESTSSVRPVIGLCEIGRAHV